MKYSKVHLASIGYELPPVVVTSEELEDRLSSLYQKLHLRPGQLEALTGIRERRWWEPNFPVSQGAVAAGRKAIEQAGLEPNDIEAVIYAGVCRENFEPATACAVADSLGINSDVYVYDISNACLGVMNGIIDLANRIELGQIKSGLVVSCESSRDINEIMIQRMLNEGSMEYFTHSLATLTGGSGAAAILVTDRSLVPDASRRLAGCATKAAPQHHQLCRWGMTLSPLALGKLIFSPEELRRVMEDLFEPETIPSVLREIMTSEKLPTTVSKWLPSERLPAAMTQFMTTDSVAVLKHGVDLGLRTWGKFLQTVGWGCESIDKVVCHQVGSGHQRTILDTLGIPLEKDFSTYPYLGNMGTVSVPLTAALADQRNFLQPGDRVGFLGIGSGLNCLMLGWEW